MKHIISLTILSVGLIGPVQAGCDSNADIVRAEYEITIRQMGETKPVSESFILWRQGIRVAHEHPEVGITDLWERMSDGRVRLVRHFDEHERGIEYHPSDIGPESDPGTWLRKRQLISGSLLESLEQKDVRGEDCEQVRRYQGEMNGASLELEWRPELALVKRLTIKADGSERTWQLEEVVFDEDQVNRGFARRDAYRMTDYADIGDNESDPFLLRMMNLGHIPHGHSGFYDAEGNPIHGAKRHPH